MVKIYLGAFYHQTYTMWAVVATAAGGAAAVALAASIVSCCRDPPVKTGYVVACALMNTAAAVAFAVFGVEAAEEAQTLLRGAQPLAHIYSSCGCTVQAIQVTAESLVNNLPRLVTTAITVAIVALGLPIASFMFVLAIGKLGRHHAVDRASSSGSSVGRDALACCRHGPTQIVEIPRQLGPDRLQAPARVQLRRSYSVDRRGEPKTNVGRCYSQRTGSCVRGGSYGAAFGYHRCTVCHRTPRGGQVNYSRR